jgi:hypothetical protein
MTIMIIRRTYYMIQRDLRNASTDEKKEVMKSALFVDAVETLLANKSRDTLQPGEAHIVIETEATDDGLNMMISCVSSLSSTNKVGIVLSLMRNLKFSPMEVIMLLMMAKDLVETDRPSPEDMLGGWFGTGSNPLSN